MGSEFEMSIIGELNFFLELQMKQTSNLYLPRKVHREDIKEVSYAGSKTQRYSYGSQFKVRC